MNSDPYTNSLLQKVEQAYNKTKDCSNCGQKLLEKCLTCEQFIKKNNVPEEDKCDSCGQELPDEEADEEEEFEEQKDGTLRKICGCCRRKCTVCPDCEQDYDSDQDFTEEEDGEDSDDGSQDVEGSEERSVDESEASGDSVSESKTASWESYEPATKHRRSF